MASANFQFGKKMQQLEDITSSLEQDGVDLDKGLAQFDEGMKLVAELRQYLNEAAGRVEQIKQKYEPTDDATLPF
jgi:exodeoxyribonuclease VII small subunit